MLLDHVEVALVGLNLVQDLQDLQDLHHQHKQPQHGQDPVLLIVLEKMVCFLILTTAEDS